MKLSVIIPMFNEERHIARTLASVRTAAEHAGIACELLVVDNGSTDASSQLAREAGARVLDGAGLGIGALRNLGARAAQGQWLAFLDADMEMPADWFILGRNIFEQDRADVFALECAAPAEAPWFARSWQLRNQSTGAARLRDWLPSANLCLPRNWFERVGGFDEQLRTGEDKDLGLRLHAAGARLLLVPTPPALHWGYEASWAEWLGKEWWRQGSHLQLLREHPGLRQWRFPLLALAVSAASLLSLASMLSIRADLAFLLLLPGVLIALALSLRQSWRHRDPLLSLQLAGLHWLRLHLTAAGLIGALFNHSSRRPARG
ncbi:glycosyltransferase [Halopseudomonas sp. Lyrl_26]|uniref:glycosyltransferase family 2 protein n=1 Tax=Halopseudomonas sp. Lyrl_26 TaxID=3110923 RepID=UPI003F8120CC